MASDSSARTPIILAVIAAVLAVAVAVSLTILLMRPAASSDRAPGTEAPAPGPAAPSQTPDATGTDGARVVLAAGGFTIEDAAGKATFTHEWADEAAPAVAALTELFGADPTEGFEEGDTHFYAYRLYEWDGFRLADVALGEGNRPRPEVDSPTYAQITANEIGDVALVAEFDLAIGLSADEVEALGPDAGPVEAAGTQTYYFAEDRSTFYADGVRDFPVTVTVEGGEVTAITYRFVPFDL
jgi:hypothetical protein